MKRVEFINNLTLVFEDMEEKNPRYDYNYDLDIWNTGDAFKLTNLNELKARIKITMK